MARLAYTAGVEFKFRVARRTATPIHKFLSKCDDRVAVGRATRIVNYAITPQARPASAVKYKDTIEYFSALARPLTPLELD